MQSPSPSRLEPLLVVAASLALASACVACGEQAPEGSPPVAVPPATRPAARVALATMWAPSTGYERVRPFLDCLDEALAATGDPALAGGTVLVQRGTYSETTALLVGGGADIGVVCTGAVVDRGLRDHFDVAYRLRFEDGEAIYRSNIIVRESDPATSLRQLEGATIAWVDPDSFTGYRLPRSYLREQGMKPEQFFGAATVTRSHDRAVEAVRTGIVRVAAVDEQILGEIEDIDELRVIWRSEAYPSPPVVVARGRPDLNAVLETVKDRPECVAGLGAVGLVPATWADYDSIAAVVSNGE